MSYTLKIDPRFSPKYNAIIYGRSLHADRGSAHSPNLMRWLGAVSGRSAAGRTWCSTICIVGTTAAGGAAKSQLHPSQPHLASSIGWKFRWESTGLAVEKYHFFTRLLYGRPTSDHALFFFFLVITLHEQAFMLIHGHHRIACEICFQKVSDFTQNRVFWVECKSVWNPAPISPETRYVRLESASFHFGCIFCTLAHF